MLESAIIGLRELGEVTRDMIFHHHCGALEKAHRDKQSLFGILQHFHGEACHADIWVEEKQGVHGSTSIKTLLFSIGDEEKPPTDLHALVTISFTVNSENNLLDCGSIHIDVFPPLMPFGTENDTIFTSGHFLDMLAEIEARKNEKSQ